MRAFIIRPFGTKADATGATIDFDLVERVLIAPALRALEYEGTTTQEIARAGNIREDMFRLLVTADLVVADLSIHNANVFYELGIRHALRDKRTFLIKCKADATVFDLQTDRYLQYDRGNPASSLNALIEGLRQTRDSVDKDSPVFLLLKDLQVQDRSLFLSVPPEFTDDVGRPRDQRLLGDLALFADEIGGLEWESAGLRIVGRTQYDLKAHAGARVTFEALRAIEGEDVEANTILGTIYQRLGDLTRSDQAIERALREKDLQIRERAELLSLRARNAKTRWQADWAGLPTDQRRMRALESPWLEMAANDYAAGFEEDLNHFYSGLNATALLVVQEELAAAMPNVWEAGFETAEEAAGRLKQKRDQIDRLSAAVRLSIQAERTRLRRAGGKDPWVDISDADLRTLVVINPRAVTAGYRQALAAAQDFNVDAARNQLQLYMDLGVRVDNARAGLEAFSPVAPAAPKADLPPRVLLFTGHMIDAPDRSHPRFPPDKEDTARQIIKEKVAEEMALDGGVGCGIAGGASGGDILFHEVCVELGLRTELYLVLPREPFIVHSVHKAGPGWVDRFDKLCARLSRRVLMDTDELPRWLRDKPNYGVWQRSNLWMLHNALSQGRMTLIALWDGQSGDGPGGTKDMVDKARAVGAKVIICDTKRLFGLD